MMTVKEAINFIYESAPDNPVAYARDCANAAIRAGDLDQGVMWKHVIIAIQDEVTKAAMRSIKDDRQEELGPDGLGSPEF